MSIAYEFAACLLVALCGGTLLFTLSAMCVMVWMAGAPHGDSREKWRSYRTGC